MLLLTGHFFNVELAKHIPPSRAQNVNQQLNIQLRVGVKNDLCRDAVRYNEDQHDEHEVH